MAVKEKEIETSVNADERSKALKLAIEKIEKDFGKGSIMKLGDKPTVNVDAIPTGALSLDVALGIGGIPRGRIIEFQGNGLNRKTIPGMKCERLFAYASAVATTTMVRVRASLQATATTGTLATTTGTALLAWLS